MLDARHAILFEPVTIGPKVLPNRFYQVPHASGFGSQKPLTQAAFRGIKAEGGWGGVCVEYAPVSADADEAPHVAANLRDDRDAAALRLTADAIHRHGSLAGHGALPRGQLQQERREPPRPDRADRRDGEHRLGVRRARDDSGRHRPRSGRLRRRRAPRTRRRLRHRLRVRRARLPADPVPVDLEQPPHRRLRREPRRPGPLRAGDPRAGAHRGRRRLRDRHAHLRRRTAGRQGRPHRADAGVRPAR